MNRKKKRLLLAVVIIVTIAAAFFVADIVIFDTEKVSDAAYTEGADTYVKREPVGRWSRGTKRIKLFS